MESAIYKWMITWGSPILRNLHRAVFMVKPWENNGTCGKRTEKMGKDVNILEDDGLSLIQRNQFQTNPHRWWIHLDEFSEWKKTGKCMFFVSSGLVWSLVRGPFQNPCFLVSFRHRIRQCQMAAHSLASWSCIGDRQTGLRQNLEHGKLMGPRKRLIGFKGPNLDFCPRDSES